MPLFEYACIDCGVEFEKIVPNSTAPVTCRECSSSRVEKKLSVFAVAGPRTEADLPAPGCGRCGADQPGMCGMN